VSQDCSGQAASRGLSAPTVAHQLIPATVRSVSSLAPDKQLILSMTYPNDLLGVNLAKVLRRLDALQASAKHGVANAPRPGPKAQM